MLPAVGILLRTLQGLIEPFQDSFSVVEGAGEAPSALWTRAEVQFEEIFFFCAFANVTERGRFFGMSRSRGAVVSTRPGAESVD